MSPILYGDGQQSRDFVNVSDIRDINIQTALNPQQASGVFNIGTGQEYPIMLILDWLQNNAGYSFAIEHRPERRKDPRHSISDIAKACRELGFTPKVSFFEGLQNLLTFQSPLASAVSGEYLPSG